MVVSLILIASTALGNFLTNPLPADDEEEHRRIEDKEGKEHPTGRVRTKKDNTLEFRQEQKVEMEVSRCFPRPAERAVG